VEFLLVGGFSVGLFFKWFDNYLSSAVEEVFGVFLLPMGF